MLVVQRQQGGDIQPLRTVADAVVAGGAGKGGLADHALGLGQQAVHLPAAEGNPHLESGDVGLHLLQVGHAGENHGDAGNGLQEPEGPGRDGFLGAHGPQGGGLLVGKAGQAAAPQGLHDPDGNMPAIQQLHLFAAVLEGPVDVVQLQLTELHILAVGVQKPLQHRQVPVAGEAQVADTAAPLLLHQIVVDAVLRVQVGVDVHLTDVVEEIEIKIVHPALFQLLLKNLLHLGHVG